MKSVALPGTGARRKIVFLALAGFLTVSLSATFAKGKRDHGGENSKHGERGGMERQIVDALDDISLTDAQKQQFKQLFSEIGKKNGSDESQGYGHDQAGGDHGKKGTLKAVSGRLGELIPGEAVTGDQLGELVTAFTSPPECTAGSNGGECEHRMPKLIVGIHKILTPEQREAFKAKLLDKANDKKSGSFWRSMFRSSMSEKLQKNITKKLALNDDQQKLLQAALPTDDQINEMRSGSSGVLTKIANAFTAENLTEEQVMATGRSNHLEMQEKLKTILEPKYNDIIAFHASLDATQKERAVSAINEIGERGERRHGHGRGGKHSRETN